MVCAQIELIREVKTTYSNVYFGLYMNNCVNSHFTEILR